MKAWMWPLHHLGSFFCLALHCSAVCGIVVPGWSDDQDVAFAPPWSIFCLSWLGAAVGRIIVPGWGEG